MLENKKIEKMRMLGENFLSQKQLMMYMPPSLDLIAMQLSGKTAPDIDHFVNAF